MRMDIFLARQLLLLHFTCILLAFYSALFKVLFNVLFKMAPVAQTRARIELNATVNPRYNEPCYNENHLTTNDGEKPHIFVRELMKFSIQQILLIIHRIL